MKKVILLSVSILLISLAYSFAEVPCKINYQGRLIKDNVPVDGTKTMKFSIHDSAVGPTLLWTSGNVSVEVHNGLFRYVLDLSSIDWTAGETLYLEVEVETEILTPREELYAYPYAINSHLLEGKAKEYFINTSGDAQTKDGALNIMGNVGIGTTSPITKLDVRGGLSLGSSPSMASVNDGDLVLKRGTSNVGHMFFVNGNYEIGAGADYAGGAMGFTVNGNPAMRILNNGNMGIGTTSPKTKATGSGYLDAKDVWLRDANSGAGGWASEVGRRIVCGKINYNGIVTQGSGFTCTRTSTGHYTITFDTAFSNNPIAVATPEARRFIAVQDISTTQVKIVTWDESYNNQETNCGFCFIAMESD